MRRAEDLKKEIAKRILDLMNTFSELVRVSIYPANIYLLRFNNRSIRKRSEICSKLAILTVEWLPSLTSFWYLYCQLWTDFTSFSSVSIVVFEQVNVSWEVCSFIIMNMCLLVGRIVCELQHFDSLKNY